MSKLTTSSVRINELLAQAQEPERRSGGALDTARAAAAAAESTLATAREAVRDFVVPLQVCHPACYMRLPARWIRACTIVAPVW